MTKVANGKPDKPKRTRMHYVRWTEKDFERLQRVTSIEEKRTGYPVGVSHIIRNFTLAKLGEWEKVNVRE